jgi:hypothetical protein
MEPRKPGAAEAILAIASTAVMTWCVIPPQERFWIKLRTLQALYNLSAKLARQEGQRGMGDELRGRDPEPRYGGAYSMSRVRDYLAKSLEGMKP